jgi:hypothetical protein
MVRGIGATPTIVVATDERCGGSKIVAVVAEKNSINKKGLSACAQAFVVTTFRFDQYSLLEEERKEPCVIAAAQNERGNPPNEHPNERQRQQHLPACWTNISRLPLLFAIERNTEECITASLIQLCWQIESVDTRCNVGTLFHGTFPFRIS